MGAASVRQRITPTTAYCGNSMGTANLTNYLDVPASISSMEPYCSRIFRAETSENRLKLSCSLEDSLVPSACSCSLYMEIRRPVIVTCFYKEPIIAYRRVFSIKLSFGLGRLIVRSTRGPHRLKHHTQKGSLHHLLHFRAYRSQLHPLTRVTVQSASAVYSGNRPEMHFKTRNYMAFPLPH